MNPNATVSPGAVPRASFRDTKIYAAIRSIRLGVRKQLFGNPRLIDRVVLDQETRKLINALPAAKMDALEISGNGWRNYPFKSMTEANYPDYDVCLKPLALESFDIIIAEQVFEHLLYPYRAAKNVYAMLRPGGYFLICTPFLLKVHNFPVDCSRWTPLGMQYFLNEAGFPLETIKVGSWGNRNVVRAIIRARTFPYFNPLLHSTKNEEIFPVQVWALARKDA